MYQVYIHYTLIFKGLGKNVRNHTHLREWNTVSQQRVIEVKFKITE